MEWSRKQRTVSIRRCGRCVPDGWPFGHGPHG